MYSEVEDSYYQGGFQAADIIKHAYIVSQELLLKSCIYNYL